jgi:hydrogenase nickel incorporation protein HypA/HybF
MHELGVTQTILDIALDAARANDAPRITRINIAVGALNGVVEESMRFYFEFLAKGTAAEGAELALEVLPAKGECRACSRDFLVPELSWTCPHCGASGLRIVQGKELRVTSIEVD